MIWLMELLMKMRNISKIALDDNLLITCDEIASALVTTPIDTNHQYFKQNT